MCMYKKAAEDKKERMRHKSHPLTIFLTIFLKQAPKGRLDVHFTNNARWSVTILRLFAPVFRV